MKSAPDSVLDVSVLLPVFLRHASAQDIIWLRRALESVHDQAYPGQVEILVVDDGSTTPVAEFAAELGSACSNVRWIRHHRNRGLVHALNSGLRHASHPLIARMDADDQWLPGKIAKQLTLFADDPDLTVTGTGMERVIPSGETVDQHIRPADWKSLLGFMFDVGCPFPHGSVVAKTAIYRLLGGYPHDATFMHCEDFALWGTWLRFFKPAMLEEVLYRYTMGMGSVSNVHAEQQARASGLVHQRFRDLELTQTLPQALNDLAAALGSSLIDAGRLAYLMWHHGIAVRLPQAALNPLASILPDRSITVPSAAERVVEPAEALGLPHTHLVETALVAYPI